MPDPLSIAVGVTSLLANSYKFSKDIYELIDSIQSAPKHIHSISDDLKALYAILGTLDSLLRNEHITQNALMKDLLANLEDALKNCVKIFREIGMVVNEYVGANGMANDGAWTKTKWTFKEKEVGLLRDHLATYKATCMMAINTATYVRTIETNNLAQRIQEDTMISSQQTQNTLAFIIRRLDAIETQRSHRYLAGREENIEHIGGEESEYNFRMRRFMVETASVLSSSSRESVVAVESLGRPVSPSLAISQDDDDGGNSDDNSDDIDGGDDGDDGDDDNDDNDAETVMANDERPLPEEMITSIPNRRASQAKDNDDTLSKASKLGQAGREGRLTSSMDLEAGSSIMSSRPRTAERSPITSPSNAPFEMLHKLPIPATSSTLGDKIRVFSTQSSYIANSPGSVGTEESRDSAQAGTVEEQEQADRALFRPMGIGQIRQPLLAELDKDTTPELQEILTYLHGHENKLYREGYFLKLDDQNSDGKPNANRTWSEFFAQLVGTILSVWDTAELDAAGEVGNVLPKFINLTDASILMIESAPTGPNDDEPLLNVLSISTIGKNRYFLHFHSHYSLVQWTASIRLAIFEYNSLQEAYTGTLINGKGKSFNNIGIFMDRARKKHEIWVRVRFGAGTPWRRLWCVITPPNEREYLKFQKEFNQMLTYDESEPPVIKGDIKFYETKKTRRVQPIAQITNVYSAFAIYPQSQRLVYTSTFVKLEGIVTLHSNSSSPIEGSVFVMPEVPPAVTGCETMIRWLFPVWDTFALYGRPHILLADTINPNSLRFAMPEKTHFGYLEVRDVANLISTEESQSWTQMQWRRNLKDLITSRMYSDEAKDLPDLPSP